MRCSHQGSFTTKITKNTKALTQRLRMFFVHFVSFVVKRLTLRLDELRWINPAARVFAIPETDERRDEFAHFEMEVGDVTAVCCADGRDLLAALHDLAGMHQHILHVSMVRLHIFSLAVFKIGVK